MNRFLLFIILIAILSCQSEEKAGPSKKDTFIRYFGSESSHIAKVALEDDDGIILLSTVEIVTETPGINNYKIKAIKTDLKGNLLWEHIYPEFGEQDTLNWKAASMIIDDDGYVIVGEEIKRKAVNTTQSKLIVLKIDKSGAQVTKWTIQSALPGVSLSGNAVLKNGANYFILGTATNNDPDDTYFAEISSTDLTTPLWSRYFGSGTTKLFNRLFRETSTRLVWGGTFITTNTEPSDVRIIKAQVNDQTTPSERPYGDKTFNEIGNDISEVIGGYAITGSSNKNGNNDIYVTKIFNSGPEIKLKENTFDFSGQNDIGNSIASTKDGGMILLGTGESGNSKGNGKEDYVLIKFNYLGEKEWSTFYGGSDSDKGASVRQSRDGGYLIFGTTSFGRLSKLMLMKVDSEGKVN